MYEHFLHYGAIKFNYKISLLYICTRDILLLHGNSGVVGRTEGSQVAISQTSVKQNELSPSKQSLSRSHTTYTLPLSC